jgi:hypothetical protein
MSKHIQWGSPEFISDWVYYLFDTGVATPDDKRKLKGLTTMNPFVYGYAVDKAVQYPEHFDAYLSKRRILGEK